MLAFTIIIMTAWLPIAWGQSSSLSSLRPSATATLRPANSVISSVVASRSSAVVATTRSSAVATSSAAAARPTLQFATIDELTSCDTTDVTWAISGLRSDQYEISLFVIDAGAASSSSSSSPSASRAAVASTVSSAVPTTVIRTSSPVAALSSASAARSTAIVGRTLAARQSQQQTNTTLVTGQMANRPYTFDVALPAGRYYISGTLNDTLRTTGRTNVFIVQEASDTACLSAEGSSSTTRSSATGGTTQTTGAGANQATTSSSISGGAIAGIVIGVIGGLAILAFLAVCCMRRRKRQARSAMGMGGHGGGGGKSDNFATLPSASSHDGENGSSAGGGGYPIASAWRHDRDADEKTIEGEYDHDPYSNTNILNRQKALPFPGSGRGEQEILTASDLPPSLGETRRQSGPPLTHTLVQKTSMQGIIGKEASSNESSTDHSRSSSNKGISRPPVTQNGSGQKDTNGNGTSVTRNTSTKRKPVPSLGPELRGQLERERKMSEGAGSSRKPSIPDVRRYSLVPDKPLPQA